MFTNTDSIKLIFEDAFRSIIDNLASTRLTLEDLHTFNEGQLPEKEFLNDSRRMSNIVDQMKLVDGIEEELELVSEYEALLSQFKTRYSDFLNNDMIDNLECLETKINGDKRLMVAYNYLLQALNSQDNYKDPVDRVQQMCVGMSLLSETLEQNIAYYSSSKASIEIFRNTALEVLRLVAIKPDYLHASQELNNYLIVLRNTSKGILWQLNHYQKPKKKGKPFEKTTLKDVAGYLKYIGEAKSINELNF